VHLKTQLLSFVVTAVLFAPTVSGQSWIEGEMGYRVSVVPEGSPAARSGLRIGDILAEPAALPQRLRDAGRGGAAIPIYRLDTNMAVYRRGSLTVVFQDADERRIGTTGDLGFQVTGTKPRSLGERAELKAGDFIPKINETFVHSIDDLKLVDDAYDKNDQVFISFIRWFPQTAEFKTLVSRRRFVK
jgi:S1-C subfamily serine protease